MIPANEAERLSLRLQYAWNHIQELATAIREWGDGKPVTCRTEPHERNGQYTYLLRAKIETNPPPDFGILIGEAVHQMRAALDNSISALVPPHLRFATSFPILLSGGRSALLGKHGIDSLPERIVDALDAVQPYQTLDKMERRGNVLHVLNELWNEDKHRTIPVVSVGHFGGVIDYRQGEDVTWQIEGGSAVYEGKILARIISPLAERDFDPRLGFDVALEKGPAAQRPIRDLLIHCHGVVVQVLTEIIPGFTFDFP